MDGDVAPFEMFTLLLKPEALDEILGDNGYLEGDDGRLCWFIVASMGVLAGRS